MIEYNSFGVICSDVMLLLIQVSGQLNHKRSSFTLARLCDNLASVFMNDSSYHIEPKS